MKIRSVFLMVVCVLLAVPAWSQTVVVTDDNSVTSGDASSVLDVKSVSKGFLAPRMTQAQRTAISSPATGLLVYQTNNIAGYYYYDGSAWQVIARGTGWIATGSDIYYNTGNVGIGNTSPTQALDVTGNVKFSGALMPNNQPGNSADLLTSAGAEAPPAWVNPATYLNGYSWGLDGNILTGTKNFGTTSNHDLPFITNNTEKMRLTTSGRLGLGINSPTVPLHVRSSEATGINPVAIFEETKDAGASNAVVLQIGNRSASSNKTFLMMGSSVSSKQWLMGTDAFGNNDHNFFLYDANSILVRMYINGTNGNTGLGTYDPQSLLHVKSTQLAGPTLSLGLFEAEADPSNFVYMQMMNTSASNSKSGWIIGGVTNQWMVGNDLLGNNTQNFYIYDLSTFNTRLFIDQDGHTGLGGNITPTEALDVTGNIKLSGAVTGGSWDGSVITPAYGGTGLGSYTAGSLLYASGTSTIAQVSPNATATKKFLTQTSSGAPVWDDVFEQTGLKVKGGSSNALTIKPNETLSAGRTLNILVGAADRTLNMGGDLTVAGAGTLSITSGKTLTATNTLTLAGTDGKGINVGAATANKFLIGDGTNMVLSTSTIPGSAGATANKVLLSDGTNYVLSTPTFPNASATTGKIIKSDGTNWVASTETYPVPGTDGNIMESDGTNWTSVVNPSEPKWTTVKVPGPTDATTNTTLANVTGLSIGGLAVSTSYEFEAVLNCNSSSAAGNKYAVNITGNTPTIVSVMYSGAISATAGSIAVTSANNTVSTTFLAVANLNGVIVIKGIFTTGSTGTGTVAIRHQKVTSGTSTVRVGSIFRIRAL